MNISQLNEDGYIILRNVFTDDELNPIRNLLEQFKSYENMDLYDPFENYYLTHRFDQGVLYDVYQRHPEFRSLVHNDRILNELECVIGKDILLYDNSLIYKPKGKKNGVPWHQDFISRKLEPQKFIVWMALDKANKENGCLKIIPRSHKAGFLPWHRVEGETHHDRVNPEFINNDEVKYVELEAGDVLIFHMQLLHSSDEVDSDLPRRAFRACYQGFDQIYTPRATPIVIRGGTPDSLIKRHNIKREFMQKLIENTNASRLKINIHFINFLIDNPSSSVTIFGTGEAGQYTTEIINNFNLFFDANVKIEYFLDNHAQSDSLFFDKKVFSPYEANLRNINKIIIASGAYLEMSKQLIDELKLPSDQVITSFLF